MQLVHQGVKLELPDDDPRVRVIETLLYGRPLPPPLPPPPASPPPEPVEPPSKAEAAPEVPPAWAALWARLSPAARRWLGRLAAGSVPIAEARREVGARPLGLHRHIAVRARAAGVTMPVRAHGRGALRRWQLAPDAVGPVQALSRT